MAWHTMFVSLLKAHMYLPKVRSIDKCEVKHTEKDSSDFAKKMLHSERRLSLRSETLGRWSLWIIP